MSLVAIRINTHATLCMRVGGGDVCVYGGGVVCGGGGLVCGGGGGGLMCVCVWGGGWRGMWAGGGGMVGWWLGAAHANSIHNHLHYFIPECQTANEVHTHPPAKGGWVKLGAGRWTV